MVRPSSQETELGWTPARGTARMHPALCGITPRRRGIRAVVPSLPDHGGRVRRAVGPEAVMSCRTVYQRGRAVVRPGCVDLSTASPAFDLIEQ